jgi:hypothetical protein
MATSGTITTTRINTAKVIEHAFRRCGLVPTLQTPDTVEIAKENLYLMLLALANRGLNLWCIDEKLIGLAENQREYTLPTGTLQVLDLLYCMPTRATGTDTVAATSHITELDDSTTIVRYGLKFDANVTAALTLSSSTDGISYTTRATLASQDWVAGDWYWYDLDPTVDATYFKVSSATAFTLTEFYLVSSVSETPMTPWGRTDYAQQTTKTTTGRPCLNYWYQKTVDPSVTLWPVVDNDYDHLRLFRHRQVQDVGTLTQQIEAPQQWYEGLIWRLAESLAFELPEVQADRRGEIRQKAAEMTFEAELSETDHAPVHIYANVSCYTA